MIVEVLPRPVERNGEPHGMSSAQFCRLRPLWWENDGLSYIDRRFLPAQIVAARAHDINAVIAAFESSAVRGPACLNIMGGFGVAFARREFQDGVHFDAAVERLINAAMRETSELRAIGRVRSVPPARAFDEAQAILRQTIRMDDAIAGHAANLLPLSGRVVIHGYSGAFSTAGSGTALAAVIVSRERGKTFDIFIGQTYASDDGAQLAARELLVAGMNAQLFASGAAPLLMSCAPVAAVIMSATAITMNGDVLADTGTFAISLGAAFHRVPIYVAAHRQTIDPTAVSAERLRPVSSEYERTGANGEFAPRFDLTPGRLISAIITEYGVARPPYHESLADVLSRPRFEAIAPPDNR